MSVGLYNVPILQRELNEILYDYINNDIKPMFSIIFYTESIADQKYNLIRVTCLKCCGIQKNQHFTDTSSERQWFKKMEYVTLTNSCNIEAEIKKATYFERTDDKNKVVKGHYDFAQLSKREKFILANIIFEENIKDIPHSFDDCIIGACQL